ncbi:ATP-binding protein [Actinoalloteichus sp. GBA129-24]|uniref:ATP-binding protein n=1 Tax=Actinoalloteichus sp. GBA129-24 TaxID=1612551 RepID=UPI0009508B7C|nr:ATP-binding protein [Actinoalloteichus sp. GBA129-24]APU20258.1 Tfp pilus assembly protein PilF [Actinoalloteichus sp. GBA129-24]
MSKTRLSLQDVIRQRQQDTFVGRTEQLGGFQTNLGFSAEDPRRRFLFSVHGPSGVGKSTLLRQFRKAAGDQGCRTALVQESAQDVPTAIEELVADLERQDVRCRKARAALTTYRERRHEVDRDPAAPDGLPTMLTRSAVRLGLRAGGGIPVLGALAAEIDADTVATNVDEVRAYLSRKFSRSEDVELLLAPVNVLTSALLVDLGAAAEHAQLALFVDTFEQVGRFLERWLLDLLAGRHGDLPPNLVLTIAGQEPLNAHHWGEYLGFRVDLALAPFTEPECQELLARRGVTEEPVIEEILRLSGRLPVLVAMLAEAGPATAAEVADPSAGAVARFLGGEPDERRRSAALLGALPRTLNADLFAELAGVAGADLDGAPDAVFRWLYSLPFVTEHPDGYRYHQVVRSVMLRDLRRRSPSRWRAMHQALADHYAAAGAALELPAGRAWADAAWRGLAMEQHYHRLCARPAAELPAALSGLVSVLYWEDSAAGAWVEMMEQAVAVVDDPALQQRAGKLSALGPTGSTEQLALLTQLASDRTLDREARSTAHLQCGMAKDRQKDHRGAVISYDKAIALNPSHVLAHVWRGMSQQELGDHERALHDFDRAIELNPEHVLAHLQRGITHRDCSRYDLALVDLTRAIELDPERVLAHIQRGITHREVGDHERALIDLDNAVTLDPDHVFAHIHRGITHEYAGDHESALADLDRAIALEPDHVHAYIRRSITHGEAGNHRCALNDLDRAIDLDPRHVLAHIQRGSTHWELGDLEQALADLDRAINLDPDHIGAYSIRAALHRVLGDDERALADLDRVVASDHQRMEARRIRGSLLLSLRRAEQALIDLDHVVEQAPADAAIFELRGYARLMLGEPERAAEDLEHAVGLDPQNVRALTILGELRLLLERHDAARAALDPTLAVEPAGPDLEQGSEIDP